MNHFRWVSGLIALALLLGQASGLAQGGEGCRGAFYRIADEPVVPQELGEIPTLRIGTYNVLALFEAREAPVDRAEQRKARRLTKKKKKKLKARGAYVPRARQPGDNQFKAPAHRQGVAQAIRESHLDIAVLQEVESLTALEQFNREYLEGRYRAFLLPGNDPQKLNIGFLVRRDLPLDVEFRTHREERWQDPTSPSGEPTLLFTRDLPVLILRSPLSEAPLMVILGTHYKSKRFRNPEDPESDLLREAQVERTAELLSRFQEEFGPDVPLLLAGDFNGTIHEEAAFVSLFERTRLTDVFDVLPAPPTPRERITHTHHPRQGVTEARQVDGVLINEALQPYVTRAWVYRYTNKKGKPLPLPGSAPQRARNPSDHFPVIFEMDFRGVLRDWSRRSGVPVPVSPISEAG